MGEIKRMAKFLNIEASYDFMQEIAERCDFENLKKADKELKAPQPELMSSAIKLLEVNPDWKIPQIYRKGGLFSLF